MGLRESIYQDLIDENIPKTKDTFHPFVLVGLGPYAKRNYFSYCKKNSVFPELIVELQSKRTETLYYLEQHNVEIPTYFIPDQYRDEKTLPEFVQHCLLSLIRAYNISHSVVATEPKAHFAFVQFFLSNGIHTLVEKPLSAPTFPSSSIEASRKIVSDFYEIQQMVHLQKDKNTRLDIQCQRRYHPVYVFLIRLIKDFLHKYEMPMTFCDIYHCDGMWNMPDEFLYRENHPYKYGYGKLYHSGYHFIDLLCWLIKTNYHYISKKPDCGELFATSFKPDDFLSVIDDKTYHKLFQTNKFKHLFSNTDKLPFEKFGELDFFSTIQLKKAQDTLMTCNLNLLQTGFSRRAWVDLPKDTYKGNGRVRHERVNIQFGPLFNIQVHSYQSSEQKGISDIASGDIGAHDHFDIYLFRNSQLIGGSPFEKITLHDVLEAEKLPQITTCNRYAREKGLKNFLTGKKSSSAIDDHALSIKIMSSAYEALFYQSVGQSSIAKFQIEDI